MSQSVHTTPPNIDGRTASFAPVFGAMSMPKFDPSEIGGAPGINLRGNDDDPSEPLPEVLLGIATTGLSGALTGGLAAGSWRGAVIGTGVNVGAWGLLTLLSGWKKTGPVSRSVLGAATMLGIASATAFVLRRSKNP